MHLFRHYLLAVFAPADDTGAPPADTGGGDGAGADGGTPTGATGAPPSTSDTGDTPPATYRPDGLPDHMFGTSDRETLDKVWTAYRGARDQIAKAGEVPKDVAGYAFQPSEKVAPFAKDFDKDPFWSATREAALKHGMPAKVFQGFVGDLLDKMVADNLVGEPFSADREAAELAPNVQDPAERAKAASRIVEENQALVAAWKEQGLDAGVADWMTSQLDRAAANKFISFVVERTGEQRPALEGVAAGATSEAEWNRRMSDPRNDVSSTKYDPAFARDTDAMARKLFGDGPRA